MTALRDGDAQPGEHTGEKSSAADELLARETIDRIAGFNGGDLPVVSVYIAVEVGPGGRKALRAKVGSLLHRVRPESHDRSADHRVRLSLRGDIERIEELVARRTFRAGAVAVFSCSGAGLFEVVQLPRSIRDQIVVDSTPWSRPMLTVLSEYHRSCVVMIERESAHTWELYLDQIRDLGEIKDRGLPKTTEGGRAGLNEHRLRNRAEGILKRHFRNVAAELDRLWRERQFDLLVVGGHEYEVPGFIELLPAHLQPRVAGTFAIDPHTATTAAVRSHAEPLLERYEAELEQQQIADVLAKSAAGGLAALGVASCLWAASVAAVQTLLVQEGTVAPGVVCDESRWLALEGDICPLCGRETRKTPDVIDELAEVVFHEGGTVRHVSPDSGLRKHKVAATLRFPLPPVPGAPPR
jgi:peptide subunit release factor 1 (eRF1)